MSDALINRQLRRAEALTRRANLALAQDDATRAREYTQAARRLLTLLQLDRIAKAAALFAA